MDLLTPRRSPYSALPLHTQKQCTARGSSWGLPSLSLTIKGSRIHLWGEGRRPCVAKPLVSSLTPSTLVLAFYTQYGLHVINCWEQTTTWIIVQNVPNHKIRTAHTLSEYILQQVALVDKLEVHNNCNRKILNSGSNRAMNGINCILQN